jgi:predicted transcriptional regulator
MSISASAVLVELNVSVWPASKIDREITDQVNTNASAVRDASQTKKNLFAGTSLRKDIEKFAAKVRLYHNQHTLPWADKGERLLPTKLFMEYKQTMNAYEQTFNMMCDNFYNEYPRLVAEAPTNLGAMYKAEDYPDLEEVKMKFGFRRAVKPVPEVGDFRLDVPAEDMRELVQEFAAQQEEKLADAMREPWERLHKMLSAMSEKLTDVEGDETKKRYHDTLLTNPIELCGLLAKMNVTNDPKLEEARRQLELTMLGANIESIKEDSHARSELKSKVDGILKKFEW